MAKTISLFLIFFCILSNTHEQADYSACSFCLSACFSLYLFCFFAYFFLFIFLFFFSLFTNFSLASPGISVSRKVQFLMPSYTSSSDIEFISAGHSSGCFLQHFLCCSMIPRAMLACTRRGRGFRLPVHFYNHYVRQTT